MTKELIIVLLLGVGIIWAWHEKTKVPTAPQHISERPTTTIPPSFPEPGMRLINQYNQRIGAVRSVGCPDIGIKIRMAGQGQVKLSGSLIYEKDRNLRMITRSTFGKESDVGSNSEHFWFWSKRMKNSVIYFAKHSNAHKTRLKSAFDPVWMMESTPINPIDIEDGFVVEKDGRFAVIKSGKDANGRNVTKMILLDPEKQAPIGHYLYNANSEIIVSREVTKFEQIQGYWMPKRIKIVWYEEGVLMTWDIKNTMLNVRPNPSDFKMPDGEKKELGAS